MAGKQEVLIRPVIAVHLYSYTDGVVMAMKVNSEEPEGLTLLTSVVRAVRIRLSLRWKRCRFFSLS